MNFVPTRGEMTLGPLIIVSGPSGSGKSTLIGRMIGRFTPRLRHSISATTRKPRPGEEDRVHYHFWTRDRFEQGIEAGEFLEYATVFGRDYYGTPKMEVEPYRERGIGVILDIDVQGAAQVRHNCPSAFLIFLMTPEGEYAKRLRARGKDSEADIARRIAEARSELLRAGEFDVRLLNDDLERASGELNRMIDGLLNGNTPENAT